MTLHDIEDKLKGLAPSIEVPEDLAGRLISAVSKHALKKQRRRLFWQYLGHGFSSVIVGFFLIQLIAPGIENANLVIAGAIILAMFWLLFKVSGVTQRQHFGRIAFSAASFGFVVATTGLFTLGLNQTVEVDTVDTMVIPNNQEVVEQAADTAPMEDKEVEELEGNGFFGKVIQIKEIGEFTNVTSLLDTGEKMTIPVPNGLFQNGILKDLAIGDRVYIENRFIHPVREESVQEKNLQSPVQES